jgi:hypothetical protein
VSSGLTGECFTLHVPRHKVDSHSDLGEHAEEDGVAIIAIKCSNTFQDEDHKLGPVTHSDQLIWPKVISHHFEWIDIMKTGSRDLKVWICDRTDCPGQDDIRAGQNRLVDSLAQIYKRIGRNRSLELEYMFIEPPFYQTDVPAWDTTCPETAPPAATKHGPPASGSAILLLLGKLLVMTSLLTASRSQIARLFFNRQAAVRIRIARQGVHIYDYQEETGQ